MSCGPLAPDPPLPAGIHGSVDDATGVCACVGGIKGGISGSRTKISPGYAATDLVNFEGRFVGPSTALSSAFCCLV